MPKGQQLGGSLSRLGIPMGPISMGSIAMVRHPECLEMGFSMEVVRRCAKVPDVKQFISKSTLPGCSAHTTCMALRE